MTAAHDPHDIDDDDEPVRPRRNKRPAPFDAIDDIFNQMGVDPGEFDKMFQDLHKSFLDAMKSGGGMEPGKPFVTGFSLRVGPDGRPHVDNFGNRPKRQPGGMPRISDEREPLTDVVEDKEHVAVTMEIPGVDKSDIHLEAKEDSLEISVETDSRKYHKIVRLPGKVKPETTKATYKNGILDVTLKRADTGHGVSIQIE